MSTGKSPILDDNKLKNMNDVKTDLISRSTKY